MNRYLQSLRCSCLPQIQKDAKNGRRMKGGKCLAWAEKCSRLVEGFGIVDLGARDREMWIDLAAILRPWTGQIVEMRLAQLGVTAEFEKWAGNRPVARR